MSLSPTPRSPSEPRNEPRAYRPRWLYFAPFLGRPPELTRRQWRMLGLVAAASFFEQYDSYLFALALKQIQTGLDVSEAGLGLLGSVVRCGALPAFFIALAADRLGRRRVLLFTILGYTLFTGATAFAPDPWTFVWVTLGGHLRADQPCTAGPGCGGDFIPGNQWTPARRNRA